MPKRSKQPIGSHAAPAQQRTRRRAHTRTPRPAAGTRFSDASRQARARRRKRRPLRIVLGVVIAALAVTATVLGYQLVTGWMQLSAEAARAVNDPWPKITGSAGNAATVSNMPDFTALQKENPDIYAWINIPGTKVNQPVLQSPTDDLFYLSHARDKSYSISGSVFSQSVNARDFSDPVTVLYGHDVDEPDLMFKTLHDFEDASFFKSHKYIYVYQPKRVLTYTVVSAYQYDDRHILNSFDFSDESVRASYFASVLKPDSVVENVRDGATLDPAKDKLLQLSTCMLNEFHGGHRYIVTGVLTREQAIG